MAVDITKDNVKAVVKAIHDLTGKEVLVGIPREAAARENETGKYGSFNNAAIGYINETGSPARNIPPRPHLVPGVGAVQDQIAGLLKAAAKEALAGNSQGVNSALEKIGLLAVGSVQKVITQGVAPALSPRTLSARRSRGHQGTTPLIETGQYRQHITYVVRNKGVAVPDLPVNASAAQPSAATAKEVVE